MSSSRREFLELVLSGAAVVALPRFTSAQARQAPLTTTPLNDHVHLISGAGGNVLVVSGADGLVMINGGAAERSDELLKTVSGLSGGKRLTTLFNKDWCARQTDSTASLGPSHAPIS